MTTFMAQNATNLLRAGIHGQNYLIFFIYKGPQSGRHHFHCQTARQLLLLKTEAGEGYDHFCGSKTSPIC